MGSADKGWSLDSLTRIAGPSHGTRGCYQSGCRCTECRRAACEYQRRLLRRKAYGGDYFPWVDPAPVRRHIWRLREIAGVGGDSIARAAGVDRQVVWSLVNGRLAASGNASGEASGSERTPVRRIRRDTARKILSVGLNDIEGGALVFTAPTRRLIEEMVAFGIPKSRIALALGKKRPALQLRGLKVTLENARAVEALHWAVWRQYPGFRKVCDCPLPEEISGELGSPRERYLA